MTTTLNKIKAHYPCKSGWEKLLKTLGKTKADDESLDLLTVLDSNGLNDTIWCLRAVEGYDFEIRGFARFCALQNIEKIKPYTSTEDYTIIINWLNTGNEDIKESAWSAAESAWSAARSAAESAARSAAESAAESAARSAAESAWSAAESARSAAESAARSAARSAAESAARLARLAAWSEQEVELKRLLGSTQNV